MDATYTTLKICIIQVKIIQVKIACGLLMPKRCFFKGGCDETAEKRW